MLKNTQNAKCARPMLGWLLGCFVLLAAGCNLGIVEAQREVDSLQARGEYHQAVKKLQAVKKIYGKKNAVLHSLDLGLLQHQAGQWKASNQSLAIADSLLGDLFTRSVVTQAGSLVSNDTVVPYRAEASEAVLIHVYKSLNYVQLGDIGAALVEMRRMDEKLTYLDRKNRSSSGWSYREDALGRWLSGWLYETAGGRTNLNDAYIAYKKAMQAYIKKYPPQEAPDTLRKNLLSSAVALGQREVAAQRKRFPKVPYVPMTQKRQGAVLTFIHFAGRAPVKVEERLQAASSSGLVVVALPRYQKRPYRIAGGVVRLNNATSQPLELLADLGVLAQRNLRKALPGMMLKAVARTVAKKQLANVAGKVSDNRQQAAAFQLIAEVYNVVSEQADLRVWSTLPDRVLITQMVVPPGTHSLRVDYQSSSGALVRSQDLGQVQVKKGATRVYLLNTRD